MRRTHARHSAAGFSSASTPTWSSFEPTRFSHGAPFTGVSPVPSHETLFSVTSGDFDHKVAQPFDNDLDDNIKEFHLMKG